MGRVLLEGRVVHIPDVKADPEYTFVEAQKLGGYRASLGVPMLREGVSIGVLSLNRSEVRPFTDKQIELVTTFADQAVIAIENARLLNELRQRTDDLTESLEQQTATSEVLRVISSSPGELEPVFEAMLDNAVQICHANFGNLWLREGNSFRIVATKGASREYRETLFSEPVMEPHPQSAMGRIALSKEVVQIDDMSNAPTYGQRMRIATIQIAKARTLVGVPMLKDDQVIGIIAIYRREVRSFTDKQISLLKNFAAQAVIAIENARLLNELRQRTSDLTESAGAADGDIGGTERHFEFAGRHSARVRNYWRTSREIVRGRCQCCLHRRGRTNSSCVDPWRDRGWSGSASTRPSKAAHRRDTHSARDPNSRRLSCRGHT